MSFLKLSNVTKKGEGDFTLSGITFSQARLEKFAIAGETGAGKSTLMKIIAGLIQHDTGDVVFEKERVRGPADQLVPGHPAIGYWDGRTPLGDAERRAEGDAGRLGVNLGLAARIGDRLFSGFIEQFRRL